MCYQHSKVNAAQGNHCLLYSVVLLAQKVTQNVSYELSRFIMNHQIHHSIGICENLLCDDLISVINYCVNCQLSQVGTSLSVCIRTQASALGVRFPMCPLTQSDIFSHHQTTPYVVQTLTVLGQLH